MANPKMVIIVRKDLGMRKGKLAAQAAHAAQEAILDRSGPIPRLKDSPDILAWLADNFRKIVVSVNSEAELLELYRQAVERGINHYLVMDLGKTEFAGVKTYTALALGPASESEVDSLSGSLPLI
ncbi:MAG: aminoacyl-tRNA hydrolase [Cyanobacteria bacterium HKST-UBA02]|nr:aminoacyl-tRNA hydrolase [Cyanobacteria bacterium HKST-UBA02]